MIKSKVQAAEYYNEGVVYRTHSIEGVRIMKGTLAVLIALPFLLVSEPALAKRVHGVFQVVKGKVFIHSKKKGKKLKAKVGKKVYPGDTIEAQKDSRAKVRMSDNNELHISPDSRIKLEKYENNPTTKKKKVLLSVIYGKIRTSVKQKYDGKENTFRVKTPSAVAGVRGTDFLTGYNQQTQATSVVTFSGTVEVGTPGPGGVIVNPVRVERGQTTQNVAGQPPAPPSNVPPQQLAQMATETNAEVGAPGPSGPRRAPASDNSNEEGGNKDGKGDKADGEGGEPGGESGPKDQGQGGEGEGPNDTAAGGPDGERGPNSEGGGPDGPGGDAFGSPGAGPQSGFGDSDMMLDDSDLGPELAESDINLDDHGGDTIGGIGENPIFHENHEIDDAVLDAIQGGPAKLIININFAQ